jgi:hypothetical protein
VILSIQGLCTNRCSAIFGCAFSSSASISATLLPGFARSAATESIASIAPVSSFTQIGSGVPQ